MRFVLFTHSLRSDWNHGNAHFLRGICTELLARGHEVSVWEPEDAWSVQNLIEDRGPEAVEDYKRAYPQLDSNTYKLLPASASSHTRFVILNGAERSEGPLHPRAASHADLNHILEAADVVIVHEWNDHALVAAVGEHRKRGGRYKLFFHDTHHRSVTAPHEMAGYDLSGYDGVLAFGEVIRQRYLENGWAKQAWTWHEAADSRVFHPQSKIPNPKSKMDLVWVGNWGDDERTAELHEFLLRPVKELGLAATVYGVRYPEHALQALKEAGITYGGSLPNYEAPAVFAQHKVTVHVPRRPYVEALPGIPTIRVFEALACGIPLVSAPWDDSEHLFRPGEDFLVARDGDEMKRHLRYLLDHPDCAQAQAQAGLETVLARHTCAHRVDELMELL